MEYPVIVERNNGIFRAFIPSLAGLSAEAQSSDEAVQNLRRSAEAYLADVELRTIRIDAPVLQKANYSAAQDWIDAAKSFEGDEEALREHFAEIEEERRRQRKEAIAGNLG